MVIASEAKQSPNLGIAGATGIPGSAYGAGVPVIPK